MAEKLDGGEGTAGKADQRPGRLRGDRRHPRRHRRVQAPEVAREEPPAVGHPDALRGREGEGATRRLPRRSGPPRRRSRGSSRGVPRPRGRRRRPRRVGRGQAAPLGGGRGRRRRRHRRPGRRTRRRGRSASEALRVVPEGDGRHRRPLPSRAPPATSSATSSPTAVVNAALFPPGGPGVDLDARGDAEPREARSSSTSPTGRSTAPPPRPGQPALEEEPIDPGRDPVLLQRMVEESRLRGSDVPNVILRLFDVLAPGAPANRFPQDALEALLDGGGGRPRLRRAPGPPPRPRRRPRDPRRARPAPGRTDDQPRKRPRRRPVARRAAPRRTGLPPGEDPGRRGAGPRRAGSPAWHARGELLRFQAKTSLETAVEEIVAARLGAPESTTSRPRPAGTSAAAGRPARRRRATSRRRSPAGSSSASSAGRSTAAVPADDAATPGTLNSAGWTALAAVPIRRSRMNICMVGTGYVGLVTGACLADFGMDVTCIDKDESKITLLKKGVSPIYEPGPRGADPQERPGQAAPLLDRHPAKPSSGRSSSSSPSAPRRARTAPPTSRSSSRSPRRSPST